MSQLSPIQLRPQGALVLYRPLELTPIPLASGRKVPVVEAFYENPPQAELVDRHVAQGGNIGLITGGKAGLAVQDFEDIRDAAAFYDGSLGKLKERTLVVSTPHNGCHVYWLSLKPVARRIRLSVEPPLDLIGERSYIVAPPSRIDHSLCDKSKCRREGFGSYTVLSPSWTIETFSGNLYEATVKRLRELGWKTSSEKPKNPILAIISGVPEGQRNNSAFLLARHLLYTIKLDYDSVLFEMRRWNQSNQPPLPEKEVVTILESASKYSGEDEIRIYSPKWRRRKA